ncbi:MAG: hypothetical protein K8R63_07225 [Bacteroidales bacterium]|nr:hypothetical protein [Bacteroidales bacterium]
MKKNKNILVCPLDWGIGHASRCVPIIRTLRDKGAHVFLGSWGRTASFLKFEFPELEHVPFPRYNISYPRNGSMAIHMLWKSPYLLRAIRKEHRVLDSLISTYDIDAVISDNRFGLWSERIPCVYVTHQVMIKAPKAFSFIEPALYHFHRKIIQHYSECWIPDLAGPNNLSGDLAHKRGTAVPAYFIGAQSRFDHSRLNGIEKRYEIMAIISGPEPQRSIFEKVLLSQLRQANVKALVVLGKPEIHPQQRTDGNIEIFAHMDTLDMQKALLSSGLIISRPGYSSIMDLAVLRKKAVFVPTPGQTEQEYLADYHMKKKHCYSVSQKAFDMNSILETAEKYTGLRTDVNNDELDGRVERLLDNKF